MRLWYSFVLTTTLKDKILETNKEATNMTYDIFGLKETDLKCKFTDEERTIYVGEKPVSRLTASLLNRQDVTKEQLTNLKSLHAELYNLFESIKDKDELTKEEALAYIGDIEDIEFEMQKNWNFDHDRNMHSNWYRDPNCSCAKLDNQDYLGTELRSYSGGCKIHKHLFSN
jgi:hypothetical protein